MNQRKDAYRAALQRRPETTAAPASAPTRVTRLDTRYVKVTVELDLAFARDLTGWAGQPLSALMRAGEAVLRPLRQAR
ncbi:hypothetical protein ABB07_05645 [Streptomyces incarnatus]|uniref:Uncharacterized protein n=1 Tax=Streptomyces incarnatus TaxID=665007 RepID=A0ABM5TEU4_9ACTN|nr:hypothetical protein [Streptomyces incarnatus]AKJ09522.1 hypothetical protein ABB07_05645 [Streptomyces incarnatus]